MSYDFHDALDSALIDDMQQSLYEFGSEFGLTEPAEDPSDMASICGGDSNWGSYFDSMSSFDSDDYEYQQGLCY